MPQQLPASCILSRKPSNRPTKTLIAGRHLKSSEAVL
jgi:hypothetical protein